jgi:hypothetical protein
LNIATLWKERGKGEETAVARIFTDFIRRLEPAGEPDPEGLTAVRETLRGALTGELRRRGLWNAPPEYLGVYGRDSWEDVLEELLADCYTFIFVDRRRSLQAQLRLKENIDGLIFLNVRHFLHERQKERDPVGAQVFAVLQAAVRSAVAEGELHVLAGDPRVRNETVLGFRPDAEPRTPAAPVGGLRSLVARWNDDLLPHLVTLRGKRQVEVVHQLRGRLAGLLDAGFEAFRFKDLIDPFKADVRARWTAILEQAAGETAVERTEDDTLQAVRLVRPDTGFEEMQVFRRLVACVLEGIERLDVSEKTRGHLTTLWQFLRIQAMAGPEGRLSERRVEDLLGIPRDRHKELRRILGRLLERCRASFRGAPARTGPRGIAP